jgi:chorismate--pyruvate lyase
LALPHTHPSTHQREPLWQSATSHLERFNHNQRYWLLDETSLTEKLITLSDGNFSVKPINEGMSKARNSESHALGIKTQHWAHIREVILYGNKRTGDNVDGKRAPWVYARTVIPYPSLQKGLRQLKFIGNKPLGEILFADPKTRRQDFEVATINGHYLPREAHQKTPAIGRRSVFIFKGQPLLVCEIFLDNLIKARK